VPLVLDLRIAHEHFGSSSDPSLNGHLHYPNDIDRSLNEASADKMRKYHADYNNNPLTLSPLCLLLLVRLGGYIVNLCAFILTGFMNVSQVSPPGPVPRANQRPPGTGVFGQPLTWVFDRTYTGFGDRFLLLKKKLGQTLFFFKRDPKRAWVRHPRPLWEATTCCRLKASGLIYLDVNPEASPMMEP
jgi:hypothetical protein